jgi:hypothetical protein
MQDAYNDMKASDEGVEKLIELEVAFLNVRSFQRCPMSRVSVCFTLFPQVPVTPEETRTLKSRGRAVAIQVCNPRLTRASRPFVPGHWQYCASK